MGLYAPNVFTAMLAASHGTGSSMSAAPADHRWAITRYLSNAWQAGVYSSRLQQQALVDRFNVVGNPFNILNYTPLGSVGTAGALANVLLTPDAAFFGELARPLFPDHNDYAIDRYVAGNNGAHPLFLDPQHIETAGERRQLIGNATVFALTAGAGGVSARASTFGAETLAAEGELPTIAFSKTHTPGIADNIEAAFADGHPSVLNRLEGRDAIRAQRADALAGQARPPSGYSLDEFPFASSQQGGAGARIAQVPVTEQNIQGGMLSSFYQKYGITHGDSFRVIVKP